MTDIEIAGLQAEKTLIVLHGKLLYLADHPELMTPELLKKMAEVARVSAVACREVTAAYSATKIVPISAHRNYRPANPSGGPAA